MYGKKLDWLELSQIQVPRIEVGEIHLWWVDLDVPADRCSEFMPMLSPAQLRRMQRLPGPQRQNRYLAGRGYLHSLLQAYLPGDSIELEFGKLGKPRLLQASRPLHFNFSDTCGRGLFAFTLENSVGVDLESLSRRGRFQSIIDRRFAPEERSCLRKNDPVDFLSCWTRKEAFGKAMGVGLQYPTNEHVLCQSLDKPEHITADQQWCLQQLFLPAMPDDFVACVVSKGQQIKRLVAMSLKEQAVHSAPQ